MFVATEKQAKEVYRALERVSSVLLKQIYAISMKF